VRSINKKDTVCCEREVANGGTAHPVMDESDRGVDPRRWEILCRAYGPENTHVRLISVAVSGVECGHVNVTVRTQPVLCEEFGKIADCLILRKI
jgi:hypothetical protein